MQLYNSIYQLIAVVDSRPLHLPAHLDIAATAFRAVYGADPVLTEASLLAEIERLAAQSGLATGGMLAVMQLTPYWAADAGEAPRAGVSLSCCGRMLYPRYVLWHARPVAVTAPYGGFLSEYPCSSARMNAAHAERYARRERAAAAIHTSRGKVMGLAYEVWCDDGSGLPSHGGVGEYPLFCVSAGRVISPSKESGAQDSVPRRLGIRALESMGVELTRRAVMEDELPAFDEIFAITPQGVVSLLSCGDGLYFNIMAEKVAAVLPKLSSERLL